MSSDLYDLKGAAAYLDTTEERVRELMPTDDGIGVEESPVVVGAGVGVR